MREKAGSVAYYFTFLAAKFYVFLNKSGTTRQCSFFQICQIVRKQAKKIVIFDNSFPDKKPQKALFCHLRFDSVFF